VEIAQEHPQRAAQPDHRRSSEATCGLNDEGADDRRGQRGELAAVDAIEIALEPAQEMAVVPDRGLAKATLLSEIDKEARGFPHEWLQRVGTSAGSCMIQQYDTEHLFDDIADRRGYLPARRHARGAAP
jgi:hypothetical protein